MKLFGLTLNVFSLAGLAVGQAIDTSVVILENIAERTGMTLVKERGEIGEGEMGDGEMERPQPNPTLQEQMIKVIASSQEVESARLLPLLPT